MTARQKFVIDAAASRFTVKAVATGMTAGLGHNPTLAIREFSGQVEFEPETINAASVSLTVKSNSMQVQDEMRDDDRRELERIMNQEVLMSAKYPEVIFQSGDIKATKMSEGVYKTEIHGKLTLNGVTRRQDLTAQVAIGPYNLRANGNFEIRQSEFDIRKVSVANGALSLRDELKFAFFVVAKLQQ
jgi:polyisoprenoid-binding protein YceI